MKIRHYKDLGYSTIFNPVTGFFARIEHDGKHEPFWSPHGPELLDIAITNWCDKECSFCYRMSNKSGHHMALSNYKAIIDAAKKIGVFQVALGGGNPNQHPQFIKFLEYAYSSKIVPNYTTNGRGLSQDIIKASASFCGAVAVSAYPPYDDISQAIEQFTQCNVRTNVHFLLDAKSIVKAIEWLRQPPEFLKGINALVFLNYKPIGKRLFEKRLLKNSKLIQEFLDLATSNVPKFKIGFDACCASGIFARTSPNINTIDACDAARFSMFISEDMKAYPCSFQKELYEGDDISPDGNFLNIWRKSENFKNFRNYLSSVHCTSCSFQPNCMNGCPIFKNIAICGLK